MEVCEDTDSTDDVVTEHTKSKPKKKSPLCRLLMQRRTKVGCMSTESEDISLQDLKRIPKASETARVTTAKNSPVKKVGEQTTQAEATINHANIMGVNVVKSEPISSPSLREHSNTTKLSLCCAMTESSRSLDHQNSASQSHISSETKNLKNGKPNGDAQSIKLPLKINSQSEEEKSVFLLKDSSSMEPCRPARTAVKQRSFEIHKTLPHSPTPSEASSCDSSPLQTSISQARLKRRCLTQRRSADNLATVASQSPTMRYSSPDSCRSAPEHRSYKKRSASHDTMLPPRQQLDERASVSAKSSSTNVGVVGPAGAFGIVASMDSLARHSLLAAQVLHLIPTAKARERNFLHGRIAANSLLGPYELERVLPQRELKIFVGTWNMNGQAPPSDLNDFLLPESVEHVPDVLVVGTQESFSERFEWEVHLQETLGPTHILYHSAWLGTLHLAIFMRRDLIWFCSVPDEASHSVRPGTAFKTKGAVAVAFILFGTSYLFVTSHLTAHLDKVKERLHDARRIVRSLDLPKVLPLRHRSKDVTQNFDCVFWCGDLNFRLAQPRDELIAWVSGQEFPLEQPHNMSGDQLRSSKTEGSVFHDFEEGPVTFPPTYKYDPGTQNFDTSQKQRAPAYTDRILFKCRNNRREKQVPGAGGRLHCLAYQSVPSVCTSDHKPVWGLYSSIVRPGVDTIPLAAGHFNRDVYLEGVKRRIAAMGRCEGSSTICSIQ